MRSATKKCLGWGIAAFVAGTVFLAVSPDVFYLVSSSGVYGFDLFNAWGLQFLTSFVSRTLFPLGAALIGAAIVIEVVLRELKPLGSADPEG